MTYRILIGLVPTLRIPVGHVHAFRGRASRASLGRASPDTMFRIEHEDARGKGTRRGGRSRYRVRGTEPIQVTRGRLDPCAGG